MKEIKAFKKEFDYFFIRFLKNKLNYKYFKNTDLKDNLNYLINLAKLGKRIRPYCFYLILESHNKKNIKNFLNILIAFEILHLFALIQDDFMDKTKFRRGVLTLNQFIYKNSNLVNKIDKKHYANSQVILLSDLLFNIFYSLIFNEKERIKNQFYKMVEEVILGQYLDLYLAGSKKINPALSLIKRKTDLKTSYYTFVRPFVIGGIYCNLNNDIINKLEKIGLLLGEIFQLQDDLFDYLKEIKTEKDKFNDLKEGQKTYITFKILNSNGFKKEFKKMFYKKLNLKEQKRIKEILEKTQVFEFLNKKLNANYKKVIFLINSLENKKLKESLFYLLNLIYERKK